jgi:hypothetical protein
MALLFEAVIPVGQRLAQGGACGMFWLQMNNTGSEILKITVEMLKTRHPDEPIPEADSQIDYLPRGFV